MLELLDQARLSRLVRLAQRGDARAFRSLYRSLHAPVFNYIARRVGHEAEDLTAKVFEKVIARLEQYDGERGGVRGWVFTIARTSVIDHLRAMRDPADGEDVEDLVADASLLPSASVENDERQRAVRTLLAELPASTREMLCLRFADGLRYREIAATLGMSEAAVKQRFSRTIRELRDKSRSLGMEGVGYAL